MLGDRTGSGEGEALLGQRFGVRRGQKGSGSGCLLGAPVSRSIPQFCLWIVEWLLLVLALGLCHHPCGAGKEQRGQTPHWVSWGGFQGEKSQSCPSPFPFGGLTWCPGDGQARFSQALCSPCGRGIVQFSVSSRFFRLKSNKNLFLLLFPLKGCVPSAGGSSKSRARRVLRAFFSPSKNVRVFFSPQM